MSVFCFPENLHGNQSQAAGARGAILTLRLWLLLFVVREIECKSYTVKTGVLL